MRRKGLIRFLVACLPWLILPVLAYFDLSLWGAAAGLAIVNHGQDLRSEDRPVELDISAASPSLR